MKAMKQVNGWSATMLRAMQTTLSASRGAPGRVDNARFVVDRG